MPTIHLLSDESSALFRFLKNHKNQAITLIEHALTEMGYELIVRAENGDEEYITTDDITKF